MRSSVSTGGETGIRPVALVTGGNRGLGLATSLNLAEAGFDVVVADLSESGDGLERVRAQARTAGSRLAYVQMDIADVAARVQKVDEAWSRFGRIDCLVNNAGIAARPLTDVLDLSPAAFDQSMSVNLRGTFFLTQEVARRMLANASPVVTRSIITVTSIAAEFASVDRAQYSLSKSALSMMVKIFALRLAASGIAVHEVRPGFMKTEMTASADTTGIDEWIADGRVPIPRWGQPDDVGRTIAGLASGAIPYSTGQPFWVAGGLNLRVSP
jgi:3-oxoacyl-[acyl-carrier protein] reductase